MSTFQTLYPGAHNFCRVFELPDTYPTGYLFGGGKQVPFLMVDWFNPWPEHFDKEPENWEQCATMLTEWLQEKRFFKPGKQYILITEFGESLLFRKTLSPEEES